MYIKSSLDQEMLRLTFGTMGLCGWSTNLGIHPLVQRRRSIKGIGLLEWTLLESFMEARTSTLIWYATLYVITMNRLCVVYESSRIYISLCRDIGELWLVSEYWERWFTEIKTAWWLVYKGLIFCMEIKEVNTDHGLIQVSISPFDAIRTSSSPYSHLVLFCSLHIFVHLYPLSNYLLWFKR